MENPNPTQEAPKAKHGGARPGAGRKRKENARNNSAAFSLSTKAYDRLKRYADDLGTNLNDALNRLLESMY